MVLPRVMVLAALQCFLLTLIMVLAHVIMLAVSPYYIDSLSYADNLCYGVSCVIVLSCYSFSC